MKATKALNVLIIEDDRYTADFFKTVLKLVGLESEVILSAKEALDRLASSAPDLILLDIRLGLEISGEDILFQVRSNPRFDKTRVVVITAYPRLAEPISDLADLILVKPVETEQLKNLMQRLRDMDFKSKFQGCRDPITELFNEEFFLARLELAFERTKRREEFRFAIIAIDFLMEPQQEALTNPDTVLAVLREIAGRLKNHIRPTDAAARLSGWKFATLHEDLKDPEVINLIVKRLNEKLSKPYETPAGPLLLKFNMAPVVHSPAFQKSSDILKVAQSAMAQQKG
jgi:PleD family two-component response regulator